MSTLRRVALGCAFGWVGAGLIFGALGHRNAVLQWIDVVVFLCAAGIIMLSDITDANGGGK